MRHLFRRLPLFWKLLVPYISLLLIVGTAGAFMITRDLSSRERATLNDQLREASLRARAVLHDDELYLLESANFASNLDGMAAALERGDASEAAALIGSVLALKRDLSLVALAAKDGSGLVEYELDPSEPKPRRMAPTDWRRSDLVVRALADPAGAKVSGLVTVKGRRALAIAAPVCSRPTQCSATGAALVAMRLDLLATKAAGDARKGVRAGITIFDDAGRVLASAGTVPGVAAAVRIPGDSLVRRTERAGTTEVETLYAPFEVQGRPIGTVAVSLPSEPTFASVGGAANRLLLLLIAALAGITAVGALLSRTIIRQTRPLLATHRALGQGDLSARAPVVTDDEIGELARGLNQMADQLQAGYETLEMRIGERTEEIQRLLHERNEFFASLSHELRTPIALIISYGDMLVDPDFSQTRRAVKERGAIIGDTGRQLLAAVNDILDLARLESGSVRIDLTDLSLAALIEELRPTIAGLASSADVKLEVDTPELPTVRADRLRMRQVILNLVDNAVKYTPPGGTVRIAAAADDATARILVADTGVGIPAGARGRLFEPFYRVPENEPRQGAFSTGLGLAITKRLVVAQSGDIAFESREGEGSTFIVTLPLSGSRTVAIADLRQIEGTRARRGRGDARHRSTRGRAS